MGRRIEFAPNRIAGAGAAASHRRRFQGDDDDPLREISVPGSASRGAPPRRSPRRPAEPASSPYAPDTPEAGSVEAIAKFTTETKFGNPGSPTSRPPTPCPLRRSTSATSPAPRASSRTSRRSRATSASSRRRRRASRCSVIGKSEEGRDILLAAIADEDGIRDLEKYKAATAALADPRKTTPEQAEAIIATARPIYYFNAGLHSTETGSPEMVMELAYRLAVSEAADDPADPQERDRADQPGLGAGRPRQGRRLVLPVPQGQDRLREPARRSRRPTGATTSSTTTIATRTSRRSS